MSLHRLTTFVIAIILLLYPFLIFFGIQFLSVKGLSLIVLCLFGLRAVFSHTNNHAIIPKYALFLLSGVGIAISTLGMLSHNIVFIKLYPVAMNVIFFSIFFVSLFAQENIIYQFAKKIARQPLPYFVTAYTRKVTIAWCLFFILNALVSCYTALFSSLHIWTLYNGLISYILIGVFFVCEFIVRLLIKRKNNK
ncbi:COG4648 family protein [Cysteiniphilum halobium]|uniref:COG4648 family protein n=1 Tax=Cysteiniphilum halobium TaxID=2219059 RepID=UPI000E651CEB|nr:hypothetical protein [Cysteiniphilum halobium]